MNTRGPYARGTDRGGGHNTWSPAEAESVERLFAEIPTRFPGRSVKAVARRLTQIAEERADLGANARA